MKTRYLIHADKTHLPVPLLAGVVQVPDGCRMVTTDDEGWIEWYGGDCPLKDGTKHEVRFRVGDKCIDDDPCSWRWGRSPGFYGIVAYRPIHDLIMERLS